MTFPHCVVSSRAAGIKSIVVASSDRGYGSHDRLPYRETFALKGRNPYDCSKSCADLISQMYAHSYGLPVGIIRSGNIYGGGDLNWSRLIPDAIRAFLAGRTFVVRSDGTFLREYLYVEDVVSAYLILARELHAGRCVGEAFNLGTAKALSVLDILTLIERAGGRPLARRILGQGAHEIKDQYLDASKARRMLGWRPLVRPSEGIRRTIEWYRAFLAHGD